MATCPRCRTRYATDVATCEIDGEPLLPDEAFHRADPDLEAGKIVGEYRIEAKIGEGGFGAVYRAVHPLIGKAAAIKVLNRQYSSNPQMVSRFIAEARAVNQIRNRNIIDIFSFGAIDDGRQFFVMELLEGMPLDRYLKQKKQLAPEEAIPVLRGVARALDAAHAAGIAHRDLKPENVFLVFEDDGEVFPKLLDFGIAKLLGDAAAGVKTRTGQPIGTPYYMSPEQCRGKAVDHRTDIYSLGILTHEMLTGRMPFTGDSVMDVMLKQTAEEPPAVSSVSPSLAKQLDAPVLEMLRKDPDARPASAGAAIEGLARAAQEAGYAVQSLPAAARALRQSGGGAPVGASSGMTPADIQAISDAQTLVDPQSGGRTSLNAAADVPETTRRRTAVLVAAVSLFAGLFGAIAVASLGAPTAAAPAALLRLPPVPEVKLPEAAAPPSHEEPEVAPAAPAEVELTIQSTPKAVQVFLGGKKIGTSGALLRLKRSDAPVKLTLKASGYVDTEVEITPSANVVLPATLTPVKGPKKGGSPTRSEVEF